MLKPIDFDMGFIPDPVLSELEHIYQISFDHIYPYTGINGNPVSLNKRSETSKKVILSSGKDFWLLKEIPWYINDISRIKEILKLQQHFYQYSGIAPMIKTNSLSEMFTYCYGRYYFIQEFVEGFSWKSDSKQSRSVGEALKLFHQFSLSGLYRGHKISEQSINENAKNVTTLVLKMFKKNRSFLSREENDLYMQFIQEASFLTRKLSEELDHIGYGQQKIVVHGDYNPNNVVFDEQQKVKAIFDFDNLCLDDPVHDISEGLVDASLVVYKKETSRFKSISEEPDILRFKEFLLGYGLDQRTQALLPASMSIIVTEFLCLGLLRKDWTIEYASSYLKRIPKLKKSIAKLLIR